MFNKICPCVFWFKKEEPKEQKNHNEIEEEQFMQHLEEEAKKSNGRPNQSDEVSIQQQLEHELGLASTFKKENQQYEEKNEYMQTKNTQKEKINQVQTTQLIPTDKIPIFKINIPEYSDYYPIVSQASKEMEDLLNTNRDCIEVNLPEKLHINKTQLRVWKKVTSGDQTAFIIEFELPCSYSFYSELMNKNYTPKDNHKLISEARLIESIFPNLCSKYLCFQKISLLDKRDMAYLKYTNGSENYHWEVCISQEALEQSIPNKFKSCKIHTNSLLIEERGSEGENPKLKIKSYIKIAANITLDKLWEKVYKEMRSYLEELWQEASQNYQEQLV